MKKGMYFVFVVIRLIGLSSNSMAAVYGGGDGGSTNPYQIWTPEQMNTIGQHSEDWASHFKLMDNINMSGVSYNIIGNSTTRFTGTFDGNGHGISNLTIDVGWQSRVGLFGWVRTGGRIVNLGVENVNIHGDYNVGGLVGFNEGGAITSCYATGTISGYDSVGGLVGDNYYGGTVTSCYAAGTVSGTYDIGGLVGWNQIATITTCYATGPVSGTAAVGGLVGANTSGTITASFWDTQTSGQAGSAGGTGKTTVQMQTLSTFTSEWDFSAGDGDPADWIMPHYDYPHLAWESIPDSGSGTQEDPYQIRTPQQMNMIGLHPEDWASHFILMADLDMSAYIGTQYHIIGNEAAPFTGTFDGNGHVIGNLTYTNPSVDNVGLFGKVGTGGQVINLAVSNVDMQGWNNVGGLCGYNSGQIGQSSASGQVRGTGNNVGGLCGCNVNTIIRCYAAANVTSTGQWAAGGLCGWNTSLGTISQSYATGAVTGIGNVGGLVGAQASSGPISQCFAAGNVTGTMGTGGFVGWHASGSFSACFWDIDTSGQSEGVGDGSFTGLTGQTTAQMKTSSTFINTGWDFVDAWDIIDLQTYPHLRAFSGGINPADINYSGTVDMDDLAILAANWLKQ